MSKEGEKGALASVLLTKVSDLFARVKTGNCQRITAHTAHDCLMSGLAIFIFKLPSMLDFDKKSRKPALFKNLRSLFHIQRAPADSTLQRRLDAIDPKWAHRAIRMTVGWLRRNRYLKRFHVNGYENLIPVLVDGTGYFTSTKVRCDHCVQRKTKDGKIRYWHGIVAAVIAHPRVRQVLPIAIEPIVKQDGVSKQDCETNAFKRLFPRLLKERRGMKFVLIMDALFAGEPTVKRLRESGSKFILTLKDKGNAFALKQLEGAASHPIGLGAEWMRLRWQHHVKLNDACGDDCRGTVLEQVQLDGKGNELRWTWFTDLTIRSVEEARRVALLARRRWAIENETFKTLKDKDGYHFEHNFGHGDQHLSTLMMLLMMLAFLIDQASELKCARFITARKRFSARRNLWQTQQVFVQHFAFASWDNLYEVLAHAGAGDLSLSLSLVPSDRPP